MQNETTSKRCEDTAHRKSASLKSKTRCFYLAKLLECTRVLTPLLLVPRLNLELSGEYTDTEIRDFVSTLPEASAEVMLAFPDRYVRDSNGVLTVVDLRPVNFQSEHEKRFRWGLSMNAKLGGGGQPPAPAAAGTRRALRTPTTYLQLTANHTIVFSDKIVIRPGLDPVNLLSGGAIGIGGGRPRHQLDGTAALTSAYHAAAAVLARARAPAHR